jgi:hypothetical protein
MHSRTRVRSVHNSTQPERAGHAFRSVDWCSYTHEFVARINHGTFVCGNGGMLLNDYFALHSHDTDALYHILRKGVNPTTPNCYVVGAALLSSGTQRPHARARAHVPRWLGSALLGGVCGLRTLA